jgi:mercuric reductase
MEKIAFRVEGMTCDHCALTIEKTFLKNPNVISARVSYARGAGEIEVKEPASFEELQKEVHEEGYELFPGDPASFGGPDVSSDTSLRHIVIIGAGSGAFAAALRASELGARVTLVERGTIGGTCVNVGCVPSKILIRQAHHVHQSMCPPFEGIRPTTPEFSAPLLKKQREGRVLELREEKYSRLLRDLPNVTFIEGTASFQSETVVLVRKKDGSEESLVADRILVATGSRPHVPEIPGLAGAPFWTSTEALFSNDVPKEMIILGGGFVALEIGQAMQRLGSRVTIIDRNPQILKRMDVDIGKSLQTYLAGEGIRFLLNAKVLGVEFENGKFTLQLDGMTVEGDGCLVATGRTPNTFGLSLEKAGVITTQNGSIVVNDRLETNVPGIFAVGDCTNLPKFVYVSAASGTRAAINMMGKETANLDLSVLPEVIFTDPQVAVVGLSEADALSRGMEVDVRTVSLDQVPRALANFDTRGWVKMVAEKKTGRLIGVQVLAPEGGEVIQTAAMAIAGGRTVREIGDQFFPYLTMVECLKLCAQSFYKDVKQLSCCAG